MNKIDYRALNERVMNDTQDLCCKINSLKASVLNSIKNECVIYEADTDVSSFFKDGVMRRTNEAMKICVSEERTYQAASKYKGKRICCLDFANCHSVGGAPWHAGAQEESMCRTSTLYPCINARREEFYEKHKRDFEAGLNDDMGTDDVIYVPDVTVFKTDESAPVLMDENDWFLTDVIVSAAPELWKDQIPENYESLMTKRIKRILDVCDMAGAEILILGAFGCGAFCNPPEIVAKIFASLIRNYGFETVEFAVYCRDDKENYEVFKRILAE